MVGRNDFLVPLPSEKTQKERVPSSVSYPGDLWSAWTQYIMEFDLPSDLQNMLLKFLKPLIDLAARSNIKRNEIPIYLLQYDKIWRKYKVYISSGKMDKKLFVYKDIIETALELQLNRSVEGWQGNLLFTQRYEVHQTEKQPTMVSKLGRFFKRKKEGQAVMVEGY